MAKILIIGKTPPPIGGVTMHVKRLIENLNNRDFPFSFCDLGSDSLVNILRALLTHRVIHIHISNPAYQLIFAIFCQLTFKTLLITYHGKWGRYGPLNNAFVRLSARFAHAAIVQDQESLREALRLNPRCRQISTYIPGGEIEPLAATLACQINERRKHYAATFCTNAWDVAFDKHGKETYGISELIERFANYPEYQLLISDPSGNYRSYIGRDMLHIPSNTFFISHLHDFRSILSLSDAFIRNTTTDGVSLSIHEAQALRIPVLASDAVERPTFCCVFRDFSKTDLKRKLEEGRQLTALSENTPDTIGELIALYRQVESQQA